MIIKKIPTGQQSDTVVLLTCLLSSIIQDLVREGKSLGLDCATIQYVIYLFNIANIKRGCYWDTGTTKSLHMQFAIVFVDIFL